MRPEVHRAEQREEREHAPVVARVVATDGSWSCMGWTGSWCLRLAYEGDEQDADDRGNERDEEEWTDIARLTTEQLVHTQADEGPAYGTGSVGLMSFSSPLTSEAKPGPRCRIARTCGSLSLYTHRS